MARASASKTSEEREEDTASTMDAPKHGDETRRGQANALARLQRAKADRVTTRDGERRRGVVGCGRGLLLPLATRQCPQAFCAENLVTALVPSEMACFESSPGRMRRTEVWISRDEMVDFLLYDASFDASDAVGG